MYTVYLPYTYTIILSKLPIVSINFIYLNNFLIGFLRKIEGKENIDTTKPYGIDTNIPTWQKIYVY